MPMSPRSICSVVYVYGTLKKDRPNHSVLQDQQPKIEFLEKAKTVDKYPLVVASRHGIPYLLDQPGTGNRIEGELYKLGEENFKILDDFEGHPKYYHRKIIKIQSNTTGKVLEAWAYVFPDFHPTLLKYDLLQSYEKAHAEKYIRPKDRDPNDRRPLGVKNSSALE